MTVTWTESFSSFTPSNTGWQDYDIYTNLGVPKGAVACIMMVNTDDSSSTTIGIRTDGASINRYLAIASFGENPPYYSNVNMYVKTHETTGLIETYTSSVADTIFYLLGYWEGVDYTETIVSTTLSSSGWNEYDAFTTASIPKGRIIDLAMANSNTSTMTIGARTGGSSLSRTVSSGCSQKSGNIYSNMCVLSNKSNGKIELYGTVAYFTGYILGYFSKKTGEVQMLNYVEGITSISFTSTGWIEANIKTASVLDELFCTFSSSVSGQVGARQTDSSSSRMVDVSVKDKLGVRAMDAMFPTMTDSSGYADVYIQNSSAEYIRDLGYFQIIYAPVTKTQGICIN